MGTILATASAAFAQSPAGYISGIVLPLGMGYAIYRFERSDRKAERRAAGLEDRFAAIERAQTESNKALTVQTEALKAVVQEIGPIKLAQSGQGEAVVTLREAVAGLRAVLGMHLRVSGAPDVIPGERSSG